MKTVFLLLLLFLLNQFSLSMFFWWTNSSICISHKEKQVQNPFIEQLLFVSLFLGLKKSQDCNSTTSKIII